MAPAALSTFLESGRSAQISEVRLGFREHLQLGVEVQGVLQQFDGFLLAMLHGAITGHVVMRQRVLRIGVERPLQRVYRGVERLGATTDVSEVDPNAGIARVEFGEFGHERFGLAQPVGLPQHGGFDGDGLREDWGERQRLVGFPHGVVVHLQVEIP